TSISGTLNGNTLAPDGVAQYTCWHVASASDIPSFTNVATVNGRPPTGPPVSGHGTVVATITQAGINVVKLASVPCADLATGVTQPSDVSCAGQFTTFTQGIITLKVPSSGGYSIPVDYQIRVTNTGSAPLTLSLNDPLCDAGSVNGPTVVSGTLNGL